MRFITNFISDDGRGIFNAIRAVRELPAILDEDLVVLKDLNNWFETNLAAPDKFSNAKNKNPESVSLSWFKDSAKQHIKKLYDVEELLSRYGVVIEVVTIRNPGYIIYEDDHQVSAIPYKTDRNKVI